ncbi:MAG: XRE family transcriptional regulator [Desulfobacterales bacterium]
MLERKGRGSQTEVAIEAGISQSYLNQIKTGSRIGSVKTLHLIAGALGTSYEDMLRLGESIFLSDTPPESAPHQPTFARSGREGPPKPFNQQGDFDFVPMAEAKLNAGGGHVVISEQYGELYAFRKDWLRQVATASHSIVLMMVEGESMTPTISDGDTVMIDMGRTRIKSGSIFAIGIEDTIIIKRLEYLVDGRIRIISDNRQEYAPYEADSKEIRIIGEVIWCAKQFIKT